MLNIVLVRSPRSVLKDDWVGYGWGSVNFSNHSSAEELMTAFHERGIGVGRQTNQIKRFFNLKAGDLVVVPTYRAFALGVVEGEKRYVDGIPYGENQVKVKFYRDKESNRLIEVSRNQVEQSFSSRLKIRMSVVSLNEFADQITKVQNELKDGNSYHFNSAISQKQLEQEEQFKQQLLSNLQNGKTYLKSGGVGLEQLVKELLLIEGYEKVTIEAKNAESGIADADITALKNDSFSDIKLIIQVKHHRGQTGGWGVEQLAALDDSKYQEENESRLILKWLITTATVSEELSESAASSNIQIMDGEAFVEWLYNNWQALSDGTLNQLGISRTPSMVL